MDTKPSDLADFLVHEESVPLNIVDLDRSFRLKIRAMARLSFPPMYDLFVRSIDVAALRRAGFASVVTLAEFERLGGPLPVGAPLRLRMEIRHCELSGAGLGQLVSRLGFECRFQFAAPVGAGDPLRYRDVVDEHPRPCGSGRLIGSFGW